MGDKRAVRCMCHVSCAVQALEELKQTNNFSLASFNTPTSTSIPMQTTADHTKQPMNENDDDGMIHKHETKELFSVAPMMAHTNRHY